MRRGLLRRGSLRSLDDFQTKIAAAPPESGILRFHLTFQLGWVQQGPESPPNTQTASLNQSPYWQLVHPNEGLLVQLGVSIMTPQWKGRLTEKIWLNDPWETC